jgi:hypothetical protein
MYIGRLRGDTQRKRKKTGAHTNDRHLKTLRNASVHVHEVWEAAEGYVEASKQAGNLNFLIWIFGNG